MAKRSRSGAAVGAAATPSPAGAVGPRQPCPCGSGKRYKACHGGTTGAAPTFVRRPFAGLAAECDLVAVREFVPAATAEVRLQEPYAGDRSVLLCSLLPMAAPAMVRQDGSVWIGLQVQHGFGDASRELAAVLLDALEAEPGAVVGLTRDPGDGPRLQDVLVDEPLDVVVHRGFDFWVSDLDDADGALAASLEQADAAAHPTQRLASVASAYWTDVGTKEHLRWVMPHEEDALLTALARVHAAGRDRLVEGARLVGMFRAHGLLVPVWDLPVGTGAEAIEDPATEVAAAVDEALASDAPLTAAERSARAGLANRQVTLR
ncbi:MAG: hypothetical protein AVDCRST_MAG36-997 [uncultured Nocardioidaceae bacterium]|uniref:DUF5926 domain-containing protein n=1 Tax=uncultured Nocardioidaceae bacterium TaxID=253824 RepID=A0A6J4LJE3_9ACTN|nr:MAG: hypothetical protein AVDCRST_MAG36-997 [uncultured Nocardioidaceae bacterium]